MQQKEAANQLQADDKITHDANNGEVEQVQRSVAQLQKHTPQIGLYSPNGNWKKNTDNVRNSSDSL